MNKLTKIATSLLCLFAMTSSVMADSLLLEEAMGQGRNLGKLDKCKERTQAIFSDGVVTLKSTKPKHRVKLCLGSLNPETTENGWRIMWQEMDNNNAFIVHKQKFKPNDPDSDSDWGNQIYILKANELDSDDPSLSAEGTFVISYFVGGQRIERSTKILTINVENHE